MDTRKRTIFTNGRRYYVTWEDKFNWLRYSCSTDSAFCAPRIAFGQNISGNHSNKLCSSGIKDWKNAKPGTFLMHQESKCHKDALLKSSNFMQIMISGEEKNIKCSISKSYEDNIKNNQEIILNIIDVIVVMGQRNIPFRAQALVARTHHPPFF